MYTLAIVKAVTSPQRAALAIVSFTEVSIGLRAEIAVGDNAEIASLTSHYMPRSASHYLGIALPRHHTTT